ncbi:MAG: hypothetical protein V4574_14890 [Pseudomonadota bacterium]
MRLLIAALALLVTLTAPAAAQRLNATRSRGGIDEGRAYCRFQAYPELKLTHLVDGSLAFGQWEQGAQEGSPAAGRLIDLLLLFRPGAEAGSVESALAFFSVHIGQPFPRPVGSGRVLVDGKDSAIPLRLEGTMRLEPGSSSTLRFVPGDGDHVRLAALMLAGRAVQLDLLDEAGATIRSYHWTLARLHDAPAVLGLAEWKCGNAVNR